MKIGFMGLGIMGGGMAPNVAAAGFDTRVYNRSADKAEALQQKGLQEMQSPAALAGWADVLVCMVTGPEAVDALLFGEEGAAQNLSPGKVVVNMSTVPPQYSETLAGRVAQTGAAFVEAPVLGSRKPAADGTLVILTAGADKDVETVSPLLQSMGKKLVPCGEVPGASRMKLTVNLLLGAQMAALCEALDFGEKSGLDRDQVLDVIMAGPLANVFYGVKEPLLRSRDYAPQFPLKHMLKDIGFAVDTAHLHDSGAPLAHTLLALYKRAEDLGHGDEDFAAVDKAF